MYDLHLETYVRQLVPPHRKKPKVLALFQVLLKPMLTLFDLFAAYRMAATLAATATGQVAILEYNCNLMAGLPSGYIYITDSPRVDFAVLIPITVSVQKEAEIYNYVRRYKLAGKLFEVVRNV